MSSPPHPPLSSSYPHRELDFYQTDEHFYLVPLKNAAGDQRALKISRTTEDLVLSEAVAAEVASLFPVRRVHALFGSIRLIAGKYLLLVSQVVKVGELQSEPLYRIEHIDLVPYHRSDLHLTEEQKRFNSQYVAMIQSFFASGPFFHFSYSYDLTRTLQSRFQDHRSSSPAEGLYAKSDKRFVWNRFLLEELFAESGIAEGLDAYCVPIMYGFVAQHAVDSVNGKRFVYTLISRRAADGAGTRMFRRGIDNSGHVANFVETEQIITYPNGACSSYVQLRGSIPLHWSQYPDLRYKPPPTINPALPHTASLAAHLRSILPPYESLVMINLINHTGQEKILLNKLHAVFRDVAQSFAPKKVHLESFDFHHECRANRWDRLSLLLDSIAPHIDRAGYFSTTEKDTYQRGCFRTNCVDSLDRTNVVQSLLAKCSLEQQLAHFGVIAPGQRVEDFPAFYHMYRNVWADNADACSIQYAGTPALKTDFTRTGKRRLYGKLQDGLNSAIRYYKNNFEDGFRQDSIDLLLGRYRVSPEEGKSDPTPLARRNMTKIVAFPLFLLVALSAFFFALLLPADRVADKAAHLLYWLVATAVIMLAMISCGSQFVDTPTLVELPPVGGNLAEESKDQ